MTKDFARMDRVELEHALTVRVFESNLIVRSLSLMGVQVDLDLVDKYNRAHPTGYTEIIVVRVGEDDADGA